MEPLRFLVLLTAAVAMFMDMQQDKVKNFWIVAAWICAGVFHVFREGLEGVEFFLMGGALPLLLLGWLFFFGMLGAGDIKLLSALGSLMGSTAVVKCIAASLLFGGILSAALLWDMGDACERGRYFINYVHKVQRTGKVTPYRKPGKHPENLHFTVPVFMAAACYAGGLF